MTLDDIRINSVGGSGIGIKAKYDGKEIQGKIPWQEIDTHWRRSLIAAIQLRMRLDAGMPS